MHIPSIPGVPPKIGKVIFALIALALLVRFRTQIASLLATVATQVAKVPGLNKVAGV